MAVEEIALPGDFPANAVGNLYSYWRGASGCTLPLSAGVTPGPGARRLLPAGIGAGLVETGQETAPGLHINFDFLILSNGAPFLNQE